MSVSNKTPASPGLSDGARDHVRELSRNFQADLVAVSQAAARNAGSDLIVVPHVNEAMGTLRRLGLRRLRNFWERPDFKVGIGAFLFGFGPTVASVAKDIIESYGPMKDHPAAMWMFMILPLIALVGGGLALAGWGWTQTDGHS